jgi:hypothetical protein
LDFASFGRHPNSDVVGLYLNPPEKATTLFAALNMLDGERYWGLHAAPSASRVPAFSQADRSADPGSLDLHLVVDYYAAHKTAAIKRWIKAASPGSICTSSRPRLPGSTWLSASSPKSPETASEL